MKIQVLMGWSVIGDQPQWNFSERTRVSFLQPLIWLGQTAVSQLNLIWTYNMLSSYSNLLFNIHRWTGGPKIRFSQVKFEDVKY